MARLLIFIQVRFSFFDVQSLAQFYLTEARMFLIMTGQLW
jgi:hypothetical protein